MADNSGQDDSQNNAPPQRPSGGPGGPGGFRGRGGPGGGRGGPPRGRGGFMRGRQVTFNEINNSFCFTKSRVHILKLCA